MTEIKTIMVTMDFSETSSSALPLARSLAEKYDARVVAVYVEEYRLPPLILDYANVGVVEHITEQQRGHAVEQLRRFVEEPLGKDIETEVTVTSGIPHQEIVRLAEEMDADLIVMSTHGRGFISHAIMGSTAERVVRRAPCPVLVTRGADAS